MAAEAGIRMNGYRVARGDRNLIVRAVTSPGDSHVEPRCYRELGARRLGVVFAPPGSAFCRRANAALNPTVPAAGATVGQPLQAPLNQRALQVLKK